MGGMHNRYWLVFMIGVIAIGALWVRENFSSTAPESVLTRSVRPTPTVARAKVYTVAGMRPGMSLSETPPCGNRTDVL